MGGTLTKVDIGHGRGWLAPTPAASLRRIDAQLGRLADINEAGRSPEQADENRRRWVAYERYLKGGPWAPKAPYALGSDQSVHCWGFAADSDDWYNAAAAAVWRDNGWRQTARYPGNKAKDEPWHGEYFEHLDNHRFAGTPAGAASSTPASRPVLSEEDDMPKNTGVIYRSPATGPESQARWIALIHNTGSGFELEVDNGRGGGKFDGAITTGLAMAYDTPSWAEVSEGAATNIKRGLAAVRAAKS